MKLSIDVFWKCLIFCWTWIFAGHLYAAPTNPLTFDKYFQLSNDSLSYQQLVMNTPKETIDYLNIPYTPKSKHHIKHFRRQLKKTLKEYPDLATKKIGTKFLINEIQQSIRFMEKGKGRKTVLKILGVIITVVLVIRTINTLNEP